MYRFHIRCTTRQHGLAVLVLMVPLVILCVFELTLARDDGPLPMILIGLILSGGIFGLGVGLRHSLLPQEAFLAITEDSVSWRKLQGFGMRTSTCPLHQIHAVRYVEDSDNPGLYLILSSGSGIHIPDQIVAGKESEFVHAIQTVAPRISTKDALPP